MALWHSVDTTALDVLADWMRRNGVIEASHGGSSVRFAEPPLTMALDEPLEREAAPVVAGMCRRCNAAPPAGIYAGQGFCRPCGFKEFNPQTLGGTT